MWDVKDTTNQLRFVRDAEFYPKRPINKEAYRTVLLVVERVLKAHFRQHRVLAEVCMGSFLATPGGRNGSFLNDKAYQSINSKRVDFLVIDAMGNPALVIEYHGTFGRDGHALAKDEIKRVTFDRAGIAWIEVPALIDEARLTAMIRERLER